MGILLDNFKENGNELGRFLIEYILTAMPVVTLALALYRSNSLHNIIPICFDA